MLPSAYYAGVDGLRGIAILSVLTYHTGVYENGIFGVDVFFVLSGFLITLMLLREFHKNGRVGLGQFYVRRAKRLLPSLLIVLGLLVVAVLVFGSAADARRLGRQGLASLLYVTNWAQIMNGDDYWNGFDAIDPLGHMWSLAITEQFYLVWPFVVIAVLGIGLRRSRGRRSSERFGWQWQTSRTKSLLLVMTVLFLVAAVLPSLLWDGENSDRLYLGTDTHSTGLVAGALAAGIHFLWQHARARRPHDASRPPSNVPSPTRVAATTTLSLALFATIVLMSLKASDYKAAWLYHGGFALAAALAGGLVLTLTSRANLVTKLLSWTPLVEIGKVSYTLFLVHLPIYWAVKAIEPRANSWDLMLLGVLLSLLVAGGLHHLVAEGIRLRSWSRKVVGVFLGLLASVTAAILIAPMTFPATVGTGSVRVLTLGDSLANDFAGALATKPDSFRVTDGGLAGCGIVGGTSNLAANGIRQNAPAGCNPWETRWAKAVETSQPDVVVVNVAWDAITHRIGGTESDACAPDFAVRYGAQLDRLGDVVLNGSKSRRLIIANARQHTPVVSPTQASCLNRSLERFASETRGVRIFDLETVVCSGTTCPEVADDGRPLYIDKRVHFSEAGKEMVAASLAPAVKAAVASAHDSAR